MDQLLPHISGFELEQFQAVQQQQLPYHVVDDLSDATSFLASQHSDIHTHTTPRAMIQHLDATHTPSPLVTSLLAIHTAISLPPTLPASRLDSTIDECTFNLVNSASILAHALTPHTHELRTSSCPSP